MDWSPVYEATVESSRSTVDFLFSIYLEPKAVWKRSRIMVNEPREVGWQGSFPRGDPPRIGKT
jgi:hypothetical protein